MGNIKISNTGESVGASFVQILLQLINTAAKLAQQLQLFLLNAFQISIKKAKKMSQELEQRIHTVEEAVVWLVNNQQSTIATQQQLVSNQDLLAESQRRLQTNQEYMAETHRMMAENITLLTQGQVELTQAQVELTQAQAELTQAQVEHTQAQAEAKQHKAETDDRFNVLLAEVRHLIGRLNLRDGENET